MTDKPFKEPKVGGKLDAAVPWMMAVGTLLAVAGFVLTFTLAPLVNGAAVSEPQVIAGTVVANKLLISQKIFYWHVPVAISSFAAVMFSAFYGVRFLMTKRACYDVRARICMEIALVFVLCVMASGELWERFEWGVWWTWEPRLTTYLILMLIVIAYFVLRNAIDEPERRGVYAAVIGIIAMVDVPICFMITRLIPSGVHPVVLREGGMSGDMGMTVAVCLAGLMLVGFALCRFRFRQVRLQERLQALKDEVEVLEEQR